MRHSYAILLYAMSSPSVDAHLVIEMSPLRFTPNAKCPFGTGTTFVALSLQSPRKTS